MGKLAAVTCENSKPSKTRDRLLGDGDGLFLRIRPNGTKTWIVEYEFKRERRKFTVGLYVRTGAPSASIGEWLRYGRMSLIQARAIAGEWKAARRAGHDPVMEWAALLAREQSDEKARETALAAEADNRLCVRPWANSWQSRWRARKVRLLSAIDLIGWR